MKKDCLPAVDHRGLQHETQALEQTHPLGSVDKVPLVVIASDRRERGNLIPYVAQRIEIAASSAAADSSQ